MFGTQEETANHILILLILQSREDWVGGIREQSYIGDTHHLAFIEFLSKVKQSCLIHIILDFPSLWHGLQGSAAFLYFATSKGPAYCHFYQLRLNQNIYQQTMSTRLSKIIIASPNTQSSECLSHLLWTFILLKKSLRESVYCIRQAVEQRTCHG